MNDAAARAKYAPTFSPVPIRSRPNAASSSPFGSDQESLLRRLMAAENEARALRVELGVLDRRLTSLESSIFLRFLRSTGVLTRTMVRRLGRALLRSPLHPLWARLAGRSRQAETYGQWLANHRARDPYRFAPPTVSGKAPLFSILIPTRDPHPAWFREALESVRRQNYPHWQACVCIDGSMPADVRTWLDRLASEDQRVAVVEGDGGGISSALNFAAARAAGDYLAFLDHDDILEPTALAHFAALVGDRPVGIVYSDEDCTDAAGVPSHPLFKPAYSPNLLLRCMYMGHFLAVSRHAFLTAGGFRPEYDGAQDFDLVLRLVEAGTEVGHVPRVLYHWREHPGSTSTGSASKPYAHAAGARALNDMARRKNWPVCVEDGARPFNYRLRATLASAARATIVIPSRNARLLRNCLDSIRRRTEGVEYDVVVGHHRSGHPAQPFESVIREFGAASVDFEGPFNYSAICNLAATRASGSVLVFLNDDIAPLTMAWLASLISTLETEGVGVAGARLLYPAGTIQHAGIALGIGDGTGHPGRSLFDSNYWPWMNSTRDVSAVSGACLAVHRKTFEMLGGFDMAFPMNYNDVDFCLRARQSGYSVVVDADAVLTHLEASTRIAGTHSSERIDFFRRWGQLLDSPDPYYSPNLSLQSETPTLAP